MISCRETCVLLLTMSAVASGCGSASTHAEQPNNEGQADAGTKQYLPVGTLPTVQVRSDGLRLRIGALGIEFDLPKAWQVGRLSPHHATLYRYQSAPAGINPTIDLLVEPRRERYDAAALLQSQLQRAFLHLSVAGSSDIRQPGRWQAVFGPYGLVGRGQVSVAAKQHLVQWHYYDASSENLHFVIAAVCPMAAKAVCPTEFKALVDGFEASIGVARPKR